MGKLFLVFLVAMMINCFAQEKVEWTENAEKIRSEFLKHLRSRITLPKEFAKAYLDNENGNYEAVKLIEFPGSPFFFLLVEGHNSVCEYKEIFSFTAKGLRMKKAFLGKGCDMDLSASVAESSEYRFIDDRTIEVLKRIEEVADSKIFGQEGSLKRSLGSEMVEIKVSEYYHFYILTDSGDIRPFKAYRVFPQTSFFALDSLHISEYSSFQLKVMRNEVYADYGYIFLTEEMNNYFRDLDWYRPKTTSVEEIYSSFSELEKANIALIQNVERAKQAEKLLSN